MLRYYCERAVAAMLAPHESKFWEELHTSFLHRLLTRLHARPTVISLAGGRQVFGQEWWTRDPEAVITLWVGEGQTRMTLFLTSLLLTNLLGAISLGRSVTLILHNLVLSPYGHDANISAFAPYYTLVVLWHILFNKLVSLTPQTNYT